MVSLDIDNYDNDIDPDTEESRTRDAHPPYLGRPVLL